MASGAGYSRGVRRLALPALALLVLSGCTAASGAQGDEVVEAVAPADLATGREVVQGTVTSVVPSGDRLEVLVRLVWAPVLRAENRTVEVHVAPVTRFVPAGFRTRLQAGDEVQVSLATEDAGRPQAAEITVLDLD